MKLDFFSAAKQNNLELWNSCLSSGNNPNELDHFGFTPLHWAVKADAFEVFCLGIETGADPLSPFRKPGSTFHDILKSGKERFYLALLEKREFFAMSEHWTHQDSDGNSVYHLLLDPSIGNEFLVFWDYCPDRFRALSLRNEEGLNLIDRASAFADWEVLEFLLTEYGTTGAKLDSYRILGILAEYNRPQLISRLCTYFLDRKMISLDSVESNQKFPPFVAAENDASESLEQFLAIGWDPFYLDENNQCIPGILELNQFKHSRILWKKYAFAYLEKFPEKKDRISKFQIKTKAFNDNDLQKLGI